MKSDALFFFGILIFFFIIWFSTGGPTRPISFAGPYITPITDVDIPQRGYGSIEGGASGTGGQSQQSVWSSLMDIENTLANLQRQSSEIRAYGEASPLSGSVKVLNTGVGAEDPDMEYITLRNVGTTTVSITGWRLVSGASGNSARIPSGAALPRSGRVNDTAPILLAPNEEAIVVTGDSPRGMSFKENMCTGYFADDQTFHPSLPRTCPIAYDVFDRFYTGNKLDDDSCYTRLQSTQMCTTPDTSGLSRACRNLIDDHLTYTGCVAQNQYSPRFAGKTWRIYLERNRELWKSSRDAVKLVDGDGKTVDLLTY